MRQVVTALAAMAIIVGLSCGGNAGKAGSGSSAIKVGLVVPLTGDVKTFGESTRNGATLAIDEANAAGGINGRKIDVVATDDKNDPTETGNAGAKLIDMDRVVAIIGSVSSKCSVPLSDECQSAKIPMITPSSTALKVTVGEDGKRKDYVFRACYIDSFQGTVGARFAIASLKAKTAAVMYDNGNDYSKGLADYFKAAFEKGGGKIVGFESYQKDDVDYSALLTKVKQSSPDVLFLPDYYNKVGLIAKQARQLGVTATFLGGDGWDSPEMAKIAGDAISGGYFTNHYSPDDPRPEVQEWVKKYEAKYGQKPDALATLGYDAALLLIQALKNSARAKPDEIKAALAAIKDFPCVSGKITFDEWGNPIKSVAVLEYAKDGQKYVTAINP